MEPVMVGNNERKEKPFMGETMLKDAARAGGRLVHGIATSRDAVVSALDDGRTAVKQLAKRTRNTMDDMVEDATHNIRRYPFCSVAIALGVGTLVGVLISRNGRRWL
jgi:ElaB/YqjD/DUF883 family membrane-anchored ribosome-binding protein